MLIEKHLRQNELVCHYGICDCCQGIGYKFVHELTPGYISLTAEDLHEDILKRMLRNKGYYMQLVLDYPDVKWYEIGKLPTTSTELPF